MASRDYYAILGLERGASADDIKRAFRALALRYHPDRRPDDIEADRRFKEILEAYETLADPDRRRQYDQLGPFYTPSGRVATPEELGDFLKSAIGGVFRRKPDRAGGSDLSAEVKVSLEDLVRGVERSFSVARQVRCGRCKGDGADPDGGARVCADCGGTGKAGGKERRLFRTECPRCDGKGRIVTQRCTRCEGEGTHGTLESLKVQVPPGVGTGQKLKLKGKGNESASGESPGDLYVIVRVEPHPVFQRRGMDLLCDLPLRFSDTALGTVVRVPTLEGETRIRVPAGTPGGKVFRVPDLGLPAVKGHERGSLHFKVYIEVPETLRADQRALLESLSLVLGVDAHPRRRDFEILLQARASARSSEKPS